MDRDVLRNRVFAALAPSAGARRCALWARRAATGFLAYRLAPAIESDLNGEALLVRRLAPTLRTVVDVGANRGDWTAQLLTAAPDVRRVLCFEPATEALEMLRARFASDARIEVVAAALSDAPGECELFEEPGAGETSSLISSHTTPLARPRLVAVGTLDNELERRGVEAVDLLKVDAEGMDLHVLRGADRMLREQRIAVAQFEYNVPWAAAGSTLAAAFRLLRGHGYDVFALLPDGLYRFEPLHIGELFSYANFVALSPERVHLFADELRRWAL